MNKSIKLLERQKFTNHFTDCGGSLQLNLEMDVADIKIDTRRSVMRSMHARSLCNVFGLFETDHGRQIIANGWRAAGITEAVRDARSTVADIIDPLKMGIPIFNSIIIFVLTLKYDNYLSYLTA